MLSLVGYLTIIYLFPLIGIIDQPFIFGKSILEHTICIISILISTILAGHQILHGKIHVRIQDVFFIVEVSDYKVVTCCLNLTSVSGSLDTITEGQPKYNASMLLALRAGMDNSVTLAYEVGVNHGDPFLRFFITSSGCVLSELEEIIRREATRVEAILITTLTNIEIHQMNGDALQRAVSSHLSSSITNEIVKTDKKDVIHNRCFILNGLPRVAPSLDSTQIGMFLSTLLRQDCSASFTCVFSRAKPGRELRKLENKWKSIRGKEKRKEESLADKAAKRKLLADYEEIQGNMGWYDASAYLILHSNDINRLDAIQEGVKGLVLSLWGGEKSFSMDYRKINGKLAYRLLTRRHINSQKLHVSRLVAYVNTPVQQLPVIAAVCVPTFTIPSRSHVDNELSIGWTIYGGKRLNSVGLKIDWLREHVTVLGATGTGKTTLVKQLIGELSRKTNVPWWIFDIKGSEYSDLVGCGTQDVLLLRPGLDPSFVIDIFDSELVSTERHAQTTFSILRELLKERNASSELSPAMEKLLRESIIEVVESSSYDNSVNALNDAIIKLAETDRIGNMTKDALLNRLEILFREPLGTVLRGGSNAIKISSLVKKRVIFDLRHISRLGGMDATRLLYNLVAKRIFDCSTKRGISSGLHHVVVLEEASNLVPESYTRDSAADITTGESMVMLQRATGQGVIVVSTRPNISSNIIANTSTKVIFRLPYDSVVGARFLSLNSEQERYLRMLKVGRALVVIPNTETFEIATRVYSSEKIDSMQAASLTQIDNDDISDLKEKKIQLNDPKKIEDEKELEKLNVHSTPISNDSLDASSGVYDRFGEIASHVVAYLASRDITTEMELQDILSTLKPQMVNEDKSEVIRDLVSLGTIEREALSLVPGGFLFTLPGKGLEAVRVVITNHIIRHLNSQYEIQENVSPSERNLIFVDNRAILILPEHLKASSIKETLEKIQFHMNNLGNEVSELIVIVRGSVAAAKLRELMNTSDVFNEVSVISAFPSSLEKMINSILHKKSHQLLTKDNEHIIEDVYESDLIDAVHNVGSATNRVIQMQLWFGLIEDFVDLSNGKVDWNILLEFIETTALQSLKGRSTPMSIEDGKRALTELLADEVLIALRIGNNEHFVDIRQGLWVVNSSILGELKTQAIDCLEKELVKKGDKVERNHGYYDICAAGRSYIVFPNQQQLNTLLNLHSDIACRKCQSKEIVCVLTASEYLEDSTVTPKNLLMKTMDNGIAALVM